LSRADLMQTASPKHRSLLRAVTALISWAAAAYFFIIVAPWITAVEVSALEERYAAQARPEWNAAVVAHGKVSEWKRGTLRENPLGFALHVAGLLATSCLTFFMAARDAKQRK
jgi:hypothetical protein